MTTTMNERLPRKAQQLLDVLAGSGMLQFRRSPLGYFKIVSDNQAVWSGFHRKTLFASIQTLYQRQLLTIIEGLDGITTIAITEAGKRIAQELKRIALPNVRPTDWDRKWRLILFDIPEAKKRSREGFRYHLRRLGFAEFQRSVFLSPFPCTEAIYALADQFQIKDHVVMITAESISNEFQFKQLFGLL
jgi:DNA-binding transcriptional regulator PaaX